MADRRKKIGRSFVLLIAAGELLYILPHRYIVRVLRFLFANGNISAERLRVVWEMDRQSLLMTAAFVVLLIVAAVNLLSLVSALMSPAGHKEKRTGPVKEKDGAVSITYKTGKARYIEQLDHFLADGVVTRQEYNELREKYEKMDIPDR